jgi:hypothetical protein
MNWTPPLTEPLTELGKIREQISGRSLTPKFTAWRQLDPDTRKRLLDELDTMFPEADTSRFPKDNAFSYAVEAAETLAARSAWLKVRSLLSP